MPKIDYRRLYESYYGPIPRDDQGRSFEIHHLDGDSTNNDISNLVCVSIQEHYDIHYQQGDWGACYSIAQRMKLDPALRAELSRLANNARVEAGTHHFLSNENAKKCAIERVAKGTHNFQDREAASRRAQKRVEDGTHHFLGGDLQRKHIEDGSHIFVRDNPVFKQIADGKNKFTDPLFHKERAQKMKENGTSSLRRLEVRAKIKKTRQLKIDSGTDHTQIKHTCPKCGTVGKGPNMTRYHFDNCIGDRTKTPGPQPYTITHTCPHCGKVGKGGTMFRHHFDRCKSRKS